MGKSPNWTPRSDKEHSLASGISTGTLGILERGESLTLRLDSVRTAGEDFLIVP